MLDAVIAVAVAVVGLACVRSDGTAFAGVPWLAAVLWVPVVVAQARARRRILYVAAGAAILCACGLVYSRGAFDWAGVVDGNDNPSLVMLRYWSPEEADALVPRMSRELQALWFAPFALVFTARRFAASTVGGRRANGVVACAFMALAVVAAAIGDVDAPWWWISLVRTACAMAVPTAVAYLFVASSRLVDDDARGAPGLAGVVVAVAAVAALPIVSSFTYDDPALRAQLLHDKDAAVFAPFIEVWPRLLLGVAAVVAALAVAHRNGLALLGVAVAAVVGAFSILSHACELWRAMPMFMGDDLVFRLPLPLHWLYELDAERHALTVDDGTLSALATSVPFAMLAVARLRVSASLATALALAAHGARISCAAAGWIAFQCAGPDVYVPNVLSGPVVSVALFAVALSAARRGTR
jgi:hypothetical protein